MFSMKNLALKFPPPLFFVFLIIIMGQVRLYWVAPQGQGTAYKGPPQFVLSLMTTRFHFSLQDAARYQHDQFHAQLEKAEDGFSIVAEYFGRGLFAAPPNFGGSASGDGGGGNGSNSMSTKSATIRQMQPGKSFKFFHAQE